MGLAAIITEVEVSAASTAFAAYDSTLKTALYNSACSVADKYVGRLLDTQAATEYYDGSRDVFLHLKRYPVTAISEVKRDLRGGFGQIPNSFGSDTILTQGEDYTLDANRGILTMIGSFGAGANWFARGYPVPTRSNQYGRGLVANYVPASWGQVLGSVKVTYTAGFTSGNKPAELISAVAQIATHLATVNNTGGKQTSSESYIDVSESYLTTTGIDHLRGGIPALGSARQILDNYRAPVVGTGWVL